MLIYLVTLYWQAGRPAHENPGFRDCLLVHWQSLSKETTISEHAVHPFVFLQFALE